MTRARGGGPAGRVFLHVGVPKTGTTFLQAVLWRQRDLALEQGLLLPLARVGDHHRACLDLTGRADRAKDPAQVPGSWRRLLAAVAAHRGDTLVSHEMFAAATEEQAARAIREVTELGREVHVVLTVRDLARQLPSLWQETVKAARDWTLAEFLHELRFGEAPAGRDLQRLLDYPGLVETWSSGIPRERVHVVTVPPPGASRTLLWERFCSAVGLEPDAFSLEVPGSNDSLGAEQVELLRRVNHELAGRMGWPAPYLPTVKRGLAQSVLAERLGTPLRVTSAELPWVRDRSALMIDQLRDSGAHLVGDLADLAVAGEPGGAAGIDVAEEMITDEAIAAIAELLVHHAEDREKEKQTLARLRQRVASQQASQQASGQRAVRRLPRLRRRGGGE